MPSPPPSRSGCGTSAAPTTSRLHVVARQPCPPLLTCTRPPLLTCTHTDMRISVVRRAIVRGTRTGLLRAARTSLGPTVRSRFVRRTGAAYPPQVPSKEGAAAVREAARALHNLSPLPPLVLQADGQVRRHCSFLGGGDQRPCRHGPTACALHVHCMCTTCACTCMHMCTACALHVHCMCTAHRPLHDHCTHTARTLYTHQGLRLAAEDHLADRGTSGHVGHQGADGFSARVRIRVRVRVLGS